jgi:excisionase family DNA binding protein
MHRNHSKGNERSHLRSTARDRGHKHKKRVMTQSDAIHPSPPLMTIPDVVHHLKLSRATIYRLIANKGLPTIHFGSAVRVDLVALRQWLESLSDE